MNRKKEMPVARVTNLREARNIAGLTQLELAKLSGVAHATIRAVETGGQKYSADLVRKLACALGCNVTRGLNGKLDGISLTRFGTDQDYTDEWFERWRTILERKKSYAKFLTYYSGMITDLLEAACELDLDSDEVNDDSEQASDCADRIVHELKIQLHSALQKDGLPGKFAGVLGRNGPPYRFEGEQSFKAISASFEALDQKLKDGKDAYVKLRSKRLKGK